MNQLEIYTNYINSKEWSVKRQSVLEDPYWGRSHQCLICHNTTNLNVHHLTYEHLENELPEDLCILCATCHHNVHFMNGRHSNRDIDINVFKLKFAKRISFSKQKTTNRSPKIKLSKRKLPRVSYFYRKWSLNRNIVVSLYYYARKEVQLPKYYSFEGWVTTKGKSKYTEMISKPEVVRSCYEDMVKTIKTNH